MDYKSLPLKPDIKFGDLEKVDIRAGTIEKVEDAEKSDKLVRLMVNFGEFKRTILVVNLEPRRMMGETSEGMLFDIGYANGITPVLALPEQPVPDGASAG